MLRMRTDGPAETQGFRTAGYGGSRQRSVHRWSGELRVDKASGRRGLGQHLQRFDPFPRPEAGASAWLREVYKELARPRNRTDQLGLWLGLPSIVFFEATSRFGGQIRQ